MTKYKTLNAIALGAAVAAALTSGAASAEVTANATVASNYIWRGVTQTSDGAAGQGGIDWGHDSGLYAGTWVSNIDFSDFSSPTDPGWAGFARGYEMDLYGGFAGEAGGFGYDLGAAYYMYPIFPGINFTEVYASGTFSVVTIGVNYTVDSASGNDPETNAGALGYFNQGDTYVYGSLDFPTKVGDISLYAGDYMFAESEKNYSAQGGAITGDIDYTHWGASIGKEGFKLAVDQASDKSPFGSRVRVTASYTIDFDLM